jgi:hypothetical protein
MILIGVLIAACASVPAADTVATSMVATMTALNVQESSPLPPLPTYSFAATYTPYFTQTPYPTYTQQPVIVVTATLSPTPKFTTLDTPLPSETPTATTSPTPISLYAFQPLTNWEGLLNDPGGYSGQLVKAFTYRNEDPAWGEYFMHSPDFGPRGVYCNLVVDQLADESIQKLGSLDWMWIYAKIVEPKDGKPQLSIYHIDEIPLPEQPKSDGLYQVGVDIASGRWKSGMDLTDTDSCYWERNDSNGNIIDNYIGIGGISMYISLGDAVIKFDGCGYMYYLGQ